MTRTAVYRCYDSADALLYVGVTKHLDQRWKFHAEDKFWWHLVTRKRVTWHDTRPPAETEERHAILAEEPTYNLTLNPKKTPVRVGDLRPNPFLAPLIAKLRQDIQTGRYPAGHQFRPGEEAALRVGASMTTYGTALGCLSREGLVTGVVEIGKRHKVLLTYYVNGGES
ncbi:GIY-YIG nuclease family protein [Streptomyces anulatus]|uniref:GIY-YIG nuclease family protein n=1 Tax=Streptomyces anulatus TaxID=1892 RepID=UPI003688C65E